MSLQHALLGLLSYKPGTGYELKTAFENSIHFFWNATLPQIYRTLNQMEEWGWLGSKVEHQEGKPSRKIYSLTGAGREELGRWLASPPDTIQLRSPMLLKVFFGNLTDPQNLASHLRQWRESHAAMIDRYEKEIVPVVEHYKNITGAVEDARYWALTLDFGMRQARMVVDWCDAALKALDSQENGGSPDK